MWRDTGRKVVLRSKSRSGLFPWVGSGFLALGTVAGVLGFEVVTTPFAPIAKVLFFFFLACLIGSGVIAFAFRRRTP